MLGQNSSATPSSLWTAALTVPDTPGRGRGKIKKSETITYPEFEQCSQYVDDQYWKDILHQCARKKFPRGFTYQEGYLKHRTSNISILLPDDLMARTQTAIYFFQENGKMYSRRDQALRQSQIENIIIQQLTDAALDWRKVATSKNRRASHIKDYVDRNYGQLPLKIRNELITQIGAGFESKYITKEHVQFENGQILHIDGITANENEVSFTRAPPVKKVSASVTYTEERSKHHQHFQNWCKYLEGFKKYVGSSTKQFDSMSSSFMTPVSGLTPDESPSYQQAEMSESLE